MQQGPPFLLIGLIFIVGVLAFGAVIIAVALSRRGAAREQWQPLAGRLGLSFASDARGQRMSGALSGFTVTVYEEARGGNARYIATVFKIERAGGLTSAQSSGVVGGARWWLAEGALVSELEGVAEAGALEAHLRELLAQASQMGPTY